MPEDRPAGHHVVPQPFKMEPTETLYHQNTRLFSASATLLAILPYNPEDTSHNAWKPNEFAVALNKTIFHPQGGGQESDWGIMEIVDDTLTDLDGKRTLLRVKEARMAKSGTSVVWHYGSLVQVPVELLSKEQGTEEDEHPAVTFALSAESMDSPVPEAWKPGANLHFRISAPRRIRNARLHSAGHLLDLGMMDIGLMGQGRLEGAKASHAEGNCWVEYVGKGVGDDWEGTVQDRRVKEEEANGEKQAANGKSGGKPVPASTSLPEKLPPVLNASLNHLLRTLDGTTITSHIVPYKQAAELCGGVLPPYIPEDATPRIVVLAQGWPGCPCGGTHLATVTELWDKEKGQSQVKITGARYKKGTLRVLYDVE